MIKEPNYIELITNKFNLKQENIKSLLFLLEEQNTIAFIARYRKEITNNLDENQIREIIEYKTKEEKLFQAKKTALNGINEQNKLTSELKNTLIQCKTIKDIEDIYAPYRLKRKTKAMLAKENGLEPIAEQILKQTNIAIPNELLNKFTKEKIISGAKDIIIEKIVFDLKNKEAFRYYFTKYGYIISKLKTKKIIDNLPEKTKQQIHKFEIYKNFTQEISKLKSYQILALNRGENLKLLNVKLEKDELPLKTLEEKYITKQTNKHPLKECIKEAFKKLFIGAQTQIRTNLTIKAQETAIETFQNNLKKLLLTKPQYNQKILAIDPGFRTGCKLAIIDENNNPKDFGTIFIHQKNNAITTINQLINRHSPNAIILGNATASNEIYDLIKDEIKLPIYIVNESGASVYSVSKTGNEEFPNLDATQRGTISIGRRFIDPLAELVKISPQNIGVGMYQHDLNQKELEKKLTYVIEDVVNTIGININTASQYLLKNISGLNKTSAKKIVKSAPYKSRKEIKKILTKKAYEQAIGFLQVPNSKEKLDSTNIHPEQYELAKYILKNNIIPTNINKHEKKLKDLYTNVNQITIKDILEAYNNSQKEIRIYDAILKIKKTRNFENIKEGDIVKGIVRNIMQFGVFVDIGLKNDGLIHISNLANKYITNPADIVQIGEEVKVKIISIDEKTKKIGLSLKDIN